MAPGSTLHFGPFSLDGMDDGLWCGPERRKLTAKAQAVLRYLVAHPGHLVRKADLLGAVWPDVHVIDWVLTTCIREIRHVLGDVTKEPRYIATVHRQGYRFIAPVTVVTTPPPPSVPVSPSQPPHAAPPECKAPQSAPTAAALEEEHKLVTILCGTLAEAPALATRLGLERWYRLLQTVVGLAQEVLQHYAGTLTLATSEGFTALFGMPVAQEDHARRGVLAALDLRQRLRNAPALRALRIGADLTLGMALHSGLVVVGGLGQDPPWPAAAVGASLHIATRLQQQAAPGTILLSAVTYHLVHAEVRAAPYGTLTLDGQPTPVSVYVVQGLLRRQAGVVGRGHRAQSLFVGRERELALLQDHLALAMGGQGQVIGVVGEPGMGKTRLLAEFCRRVPEAQVTVYEGRCLSYGQATPYLPVRDVVRQVCGLMEGDEVTGHTAAVQERLHESGMTAEDDVALLLQLLDLPVAPECLARLSSEARQVRTFALLRHLILDAAQRQPLVLVVENLHWSDPTSEAWLASLVERLAGSAVLLLGTYRPGYQPAWGAHTAVMQVAVPPLRVQDSRTIVQAAEFLYETRVVPELTYTFKHALTHDVAYSSLLRERRRGLHARLVEALEAQTPERVAEQVERLAHHAVRGEVWGKAVTYGRQAGAKAYDRAAFREAVTAFEQALRALIHLPDDGETRRLAIELRLALAGPLSDLGEHGRRLVLLGEAEALARGLKDRARLAQVLARMAEGLRITGDHDGALATGQEALALAAALGDRALQAQSCHRLGQVYAAIGDFGRAAEMLRRSVEAADRGGDRLSTEVRMQSRAWLAYTLSELGAFAEGRRHGEEALRLATQESRGVTPIIAHGCLGEVYLAQGDLAPAIRVLEQGLPLCRASGNRLWGRRIVADLGSAAVLQGCLVEGRAQLEEAIRESLHTGARQHQARWVAWLSEVWRLAGRREEAWLHARQAFNLARLQKARGEEAVALHQLGTVHAHAALPDAAQAEAYYQQALALADELGMRPLQAHGHLGLGILYATTGQRQQARAALSTATEMYRAMEMTWWLPQAEAALAQVV